MRSLFDGSFAPSKDLNVTGLWAAMQRPAGTAARLRIWTVVAFRRNRKVRARRSHPEPSRCLRTRALPRGRPRVPPAAARQCPDFSRPRCDFIRPANRHTRPALVPLDLDRRRGELPSQAYGKSVTRGVLTAMPGAVAPPVLSMTFEIPPLLVRLTVVRWWNLTLAVFGTSTARVRKTLALVNTL